TMVAAVARWSPAPRLSWNVPLRLPALAFVLGSGLFLVGIPLERLTVVIPLYMPLLDTATVLCLGVVIVIGSIDVVARRNTRSLPIVSASAAIGAAWLPHLVAFPVVPSALGFYLTAQTSSAIASFAQMATPAFLALALL